MQEGISYMSSAEIPCLIVNVQRGGPGLGTIQPSQGDYFQATKGGGHGDYRLFVLAPASVQEMADFVFEGFRLADKYRNPTMILADGALGQMMEKVLLPPEGSLPYTEKPWATTGKPEKGDRRILTSLHLEPEKMEEINLKLQDKYRRMKQDVRDQLVGEEKPEIVTCRFRSYRQGMSEDDRARKRAGDQCRIIEADYPVPISERCNSFLGGYHGRVLDR